MRHRLVNEGSAGMSGGALDVTQVSAQPRPEILKLGQLWAVETLGRVVEQHEAALDVAGCEDREGRQRPHRRGLTVGESRIAGGEVVQRTHDRLARAHRVVQRHVVIGVDFAPVDPEVVVAVACTKEQPTPAALSQRQSRPTDPRYLAELSERGPHPRIPVSDRSARDPVPHLLRIGPFKPYKTHKKRREAEPMRTSSWTLLEKPNSQQNVRLSAARRAPMPGSHTL